MAKPTQIKRRLQRLLGTHVLFALIISLTGCAVLRGSYESSVSASQMSQYDADTSTRTGWLVFTPKTHSHTGVIFYPGGKVAPDAYASLANQLSLSLNTSVIIVPMPLDLAVLGGKRAQTVIDAYPDIEKWVIGGHSLGGTMAASFAYKNPDLLAGLFFLASYPQNKHNFATSSLPILTLLGSRDGLISRDKWQQLQALLPENATKLVIDGGNHAGFGTYGPQADDRSARISAEEQQRQTVQAFSQWFKSALGEAE